MTRSKTQNSLPGHERLDAFVDAFRSLLAALPANVADEIAPLLFEAEAKATIALAEPPVQGDGP